MGNWSIEIHGMGAHHNKELAEDANRMAQRFVDDLRAKGHYVTTATFHHGARDDLLVEDYRARGCANDELDFVPKEGDVVLFRKDDAYVDATITKVWSPFCINVQVASEEGERTSVIRGADSNPTFHWVPKDE